MFIAPSSRATTGPLCASSVTWGITAFLQPASALDEARNRSLRDPGIFAVEMTEPVLMPTQLVGRAVAHVRQAGGDADALIRAHELPRTVEKDPFVLLPVPRIRAILDDAERAARDPF